MSCDGCLGPNAPYCGSSGGCVRGGHGCGGGDVDDDTMQSVSTNEKTPLSSF